MMLIAIPVDNVAWDWISQKLYWTDKDNDTIKVYDPERDIQKTLLNTGVGSQPRAIVVDPSTRYNKALGLHIIL